MLNIVDAVKNFHYNCDKDAISKYFASINAITYLPVLLFKINEKIKKQLLKCLANKCCMNHHYYITDEYQYRVNHRLKEESYVKCSLRKIYKILRNYQEVTPFHNISCECMFCVVKKSILKIIKDSYIENIDESYQIKLNKNL